ncbi:hypothetical protein HX089_16580 [Myroides odoratimimus]|uniref:hypothetical protein n=1 Tax=Myroides odoratimimus TaxID=76832 RepID=UPI002578EE8D|nr:hypothetical protein [Myroides odoratimimus]MDM1507504.1 hypothetical protein [Myroides odoratimimus]MDM1517980.1 hypothetical protein [Myroides odoratimimus]
MARYFLGIDPGKQGALVVLDENSKIVEMFGMPLIGNEYDKKTIVDILKSYEFIHIGLENPNVIASVSKSSVASLFKCVGMFEGLLMGLGLSHSLINPKVWQSEVWQNIKKQTKQTSDGKKKTDTKATSTLAANNLFASVDFKVTNKLSKSKNYNDGMIDAALIAEYVRRKFKIE